MTQWWRLLYDAGRNPIVRWVHDWGPNQEDGFIQAKDHLDRRIVFDQTSDWFMQEIDELPPKKQRERKEALEALADAR